MSLDIMKESTLQSVYRELEKQNVYLSVIANAKPGSIKIENFKTVQEIVQNGLAPKVFNIGDQFICKWTDTAANKTYDWFWDIVDFRDVTLENGEIVPGLYIQSHYTTPFGVQFDNVENERATESTFLEGYSYYTKNQDGSFKLETVVNGSPIPTETVYYHSAIKDPTGNICRYGYNRWRHSAARQWLNSDKPKNEWWAAQHLGDVAPGELRTKDGFLRGFDQEFLSCLKKVKIKTPLNTITDSAIGTEEETTDLMFLASRQQLYGGLESGAHNDEVFDYYKKTLGIGSPSDGANPNRIKYGLEAHTSPQNYRLRSPFRGYSYGTWYGLATGYLNGNNANFACRLCPVCVIA